MSAIAAPRQHSGKYLRGIEFPRCLQPISNLFERFSFFHIQPFNLRLELPPIERHCEVFLAGKSSATREAQRARQEMNKAAKQG